MRALARSFRQHFHDVVAVRGNDTCRDPNGIVFTRFLHKKIETEKSQNVNWHHNSPMRISYILRQHMNRARLQGFHQQSFALFVKHW